MRSTRRRYPPPGYIIFDGEKYLESSDEDDGDVYDADVNDVESFDILLKVRNRDPSLKTSQEVTSLVDKYNNLDDDIDIKDDVEHEKKLDEYFSYDDKLSESDKCFLKEFFRKKMWICKDGHDGLDDIDILLEDEIDMLRQACYEVAYSLRQEEYSEEKMRVHTRYFEDSIRELEDARKRERENMAQAEIERIEEVKCLKEEETQNADDRKQSRKERRYLRLHEVMFRPSRRLAYNVFNLRKKRRTKA